MLIRYGTDKNGKRIKKAYIYTENEHRIDAGKIDPDARKVTERLRRAGFEAYVVGGAVRDLLLGKEPKDFDIATDAHPRQIRHLFRNSRVIGRRFRLAHIHFRDKILEVSTFRSGEAGDGGNVYGTLEEDVRRRDFSINALYYCPHNRHLIDYVGGFDDIKAGQMHSLIPLETTFKEDPVRLIRTVKYSITTGFSIPGKLKKAVRRNAPELQQASISRLTEELFKILQSGCSASIIMGCAEYGLLEAMVPKINRELDACAREKKLEEFWQRLDKMDQLVKQDKAGRSDMLQALTGLFVKVPQEALSPELLFRDVFSSVKTLLAPLTPPNKEVEGAVRGILKEKGLYAGKRKKSKPRRRRNYNRNRRRSPNRGEAPARGENPGTP